MIQWFLENWGTLAGVCGLFGVGLQIAPQPIKPITWLVKWFGRVANEETHKQIEELKQEVKAVTDRQSKFEEKYDKSVIGAKRREIVDFSISCQKNEKHTRQDFDRFFELVEEYHDLLDKYGLENGKITIEVEYVTGVYKNCIQNHKFFEG